MLDPNKGVQLIFYPHKQDKEVALTTRRHWLPKRVF